MILPGLPADRLADLVDGTDIIQNRLRPSKNCAATPALEGLDRLAARKGVPTTNGGGRYCAKFPKNGTRVVP
jgi:hypothetical protein